VLIDGVHCTAGNAREQVNRLDVDAEATKNSWFVLHLKFM